MEERTLVVTGEQIEKLIQWFYRIQRPQDLDQLASQYIEIVKQEV